LHFLGGADDSGRAFSAVTIGRTATAAREDVCRAGRESV